LELNDILSPIATRLEAVEAELRKIAHSQVPIASRLADEICASGGKRLRPALVLLSAKYCGCNSDEDIRYAAVFEMVHTATLIHDDVIDHSPTRRGRPSMNAKWGNTLSVLFGDFLSIHSMRYALASRNWQMAELFADVAANMIEGELIQNECLYSLKVRRQTHFDIIERKTAHLFSACTKSGAILAGRSEGASQALAKYGFELGKAFQLIDDLLDYTSTASHLGKPVFSDLAEGKLTLPAISLMEKAPGDAAPLIEKIWAADKAAGQAASTEKEINSLLELMKRHGALDETRELAKNASRAAAEALPDIEGAEDAKAVAALLKEIPEILLARTY
jgi:octaprenyl-diphosphate synthase